MADSTPPVKDTIRLGDEDGFCLHTWNKETSNDDAVVVVYHGFSAHSLYPTVRYAAELLASNDKKFLKVLAADMRGHGQSPGLQGYLPSVDVLLDDAVKVAEYAIETHQPKKLFLLGSSMGGTIALKVAERLASDNNDNKGVVAGALLLAPMLKLSVSSVERTLLSWLTYAIPTWQLIPSSSQNAGKQYRDETKRQECENDPYTSANKSSTIRIGSASTCVELAQQFHPQDVAIPFWVGVADQDVVVDSQGSLDLYELSPSKDKTMKRYAALHGLLCEPSPLFEEICNDILDWVGERC